ncbi:LuxR C-terminal-related transcriptional regulator [Sedimenticola sp.]|uniref:LuxR C-terminal-related transcriptional regulator n=1 Tax=Sedimenticola sp. TaxID=1940285 RepID=UPI003D0BFBFD
MSGSKMILLCSNNKQVADHWLNGLSESQIAIESVADLNQLKQSLKESRDQLVILDLDMLGMDAIEVVSALLVRYPSIRIFSMTTKPNPTQGVAMACAGVHGYGNCWMHPSTLSQSTSLIQSGEVWLGQEVIQHLIKGVAVGAPAETEQEPSQSDRLAELTAREQEIAQRVANGQSNKLIAYELGITERTVKAHLGNIFQKSGTKNRLQLALLANGHGV